MAGVPFGALHDSLVGGPSCHRRARRSAAVGSVYHFVAQLAQSKRATYHCDGVAQRAAAVRASGCFVGISGISDIVLYYSNTISAAKMPKWQMRLKAFSLTPRERERYAGFWS